jgi:hypothetical protein
MPLSLLADDNERTLVQPHEVLGAGVSRFVVWTHDVPVK